MTKNSVFSKSMLAILFLLTAFHVIGQDVPKRELRAAWIATVANIDWPSQKGLSSQRQQEEFCVLLDTLQSVGMNAVIVQVRPTADAFYPSSFEPWSEFLSGVQGRQPEPFYNPLSFMIAQARARGMEFHAWFNPYRVSMKEDFIPAPGHPMNDHPEWFVTYGGKWYYDPGHPYAREYVLQTILEVVKHNDIDAVHFDDYFYPYRIANVEFPDDSSFAMYGESIFADRESWRRHNVDYFVENLAIRIAQEKPHVKFGISPFGVWRNSDKDARGSRTEAGQTNYDDLFADVLKWLDKGWIDYVTPQIYWHIGFEKAEYKTLVDWWSKNANGRHVYIGQGIYRIGQKGWTNQNEIINQVKYNRSVTPVGGSMYFSAKIFAQNKDGINKKIDSLYRYKALVPEMSWKKSGPVYPPRLINVSGSPRAGVDLEWKNEQDGNEAYYVVYRFGGPFAGSLDDPRNIIATVPRQFSSTQKWKDKTARKRTAYTYLITSADRLHNESKAGNAIIVKTRGSKRSLVLQK